MPDHQVTTKPSTPVEQQDWVDTAEELPPRPRRRVLRPLPLALLGVLLLACGFIGGVLVEKGQMSSTEPSGTEALTGRFAAVRGGPAAAGARGLSLAAGRTGALDSVATSAGSGVVGRFGNSGPGRATIGQVAYVEAHNLYVEDAEGTTIKVTTSTHSIVTKTVKSSVKAIHPGETVVVQGTVDSRGTVAASSIGVSRGGLGRGLGALLSGGGTGGPRAAGSSEGPALFGK